MVALVLAVALADDPKHPTSIVAEHCIDCHRVPGFLDQNRNPDQQAPDFQAIADDPKTFTDDRLRRFLRQPHFPMRKLTLTEQDIGGLVAYIRSLRNGRQVD